MGEHTRIWTSKKDALLKKEKQLKDELENVSQLFEGRTKAVIITALIVGGISLTGYLAYKAFSKKEEPETTSKKKKKGKKASKRTNTILGTLLTERLVSSALKYAENQLNQALSSKADKSKK